MGTEKEKELSGLRKERLKLEKEAKIAASIEAEKKKIETAKKKISPQNTTKTSRGWGEKIRESIASSGIDFSNFGDHLKIESGGKKNAR